MLMKVILETRREQ